MMIREAFVRFSRRPDAAGETVREGGAGDAVRERSHMWGRLCVLASLAVAVAILALLESSVWRAVLVAFLLACPVVAIWGLITGLRPLPFPVGPVPATHGYPLNWIAPYYDVACRLIGLGGGFRRYTVAVAQLQPGEAVLDAGCGTGILTRLAAEAVRPTGGVLGIDPAPDMIRVARINAANAGNTARFKPATIEDLPFEDGSFDVVLASLVLHHLPPDLRQVGVREVRRVLRPGGRLIVADLGRSAAFLWRLMFWPLQRHGDTGPPLPGIDDLLRTAGFEQVTAAGRWVPMLTFWTAYKALPIGERSE